MSELATHLNAGEIKCPRCHQAVSTVAAVKERDDAGMPIIEQICRGKCGCGVFLEQELIPNALNKKTA